MSGLPGVCNTDTVPVESHIHRKTRVIQAQDVCLIQRRKYSRCPLQYLMIPLRPIFLSLKYTIKICFGTPLELHSWPTNDPSCSMSDTNSPGCLWASHTARALRAPSFAASFDRNVSTISKSRVGICSMASEHGQRATGPSPDDRSV
jgi:hypothetical protein